ncbi:unnamed protein product [Rotaria sp. Silwood2]|nr:unnamed protein product [Rotaria sp. Silwood2]
MNLLKHHLPSTSAKYLYLFFDLPEVSTTNHSNNDTISPKEKRISLQQIFFSNARCISQCVNNLRQETWDLSSVDMAHVYETLICLLIESASLSPSLMNDFRLAHCYVHMKDIILRLENEWINDESEKLFAGFITLLGDFTYAGYHELKLPARPETIFDIPNFVMPQSKNTDALRELGFIEVLITRLHHFAMLLKESVQDLNDKGDNMNQEEKELGFMVVEALALLLSHNQKNAKIFREHDGARLARNIIPYRLCRVAALTVVLHLVLCTGGEDDTGALLGLIHTAKLEKLEMKSVILKGFLYILSLINPVSKNEPVKSGTSIDNTEESVSSPLFRIGTFSMPTTTRTSATFTFPSYMEKPIIVYPGAIVCFLQIIACIPRMIDEQIRTKT